MRAERYNDPQDDSMSGCLVTLTHSISVAARISMIAYEIPACRVLRDHSRHYRVGLWISVMRWITELSTSGNESCVHRSSLVSSP